MTVNEQSDFIFQKQVFKSLLNGERDLHRLARVGVIHCAAVHGTMPYVDRQINIRTKPPLEFVFISSAPQNTNTAVPLLSGVL